MHLTIAIPQEIFSPKVFASLAIILLISYTCIIWFVQYRRLRDFQGPRSAAWLNLWLFRKMVGGQMHLEFYQSFKKYGQYYPFSFNRS